MTNDNVFFEEPKKNMSPSGKAYHVFLSHRSADKPMVEEIAVRLRRSGIEPWLDKWNLIPGEAWQPAIERALGACATCAVFIGTGGFGPWQNEEMRAAINRRVQDDKGAFRVIPVLLPGAERPERSKLPTFLSATTWVEFRSSLEDAETFRRLVCGIRGIEPGLYLGETIQEGTCPYRGLKFFDVQHALFFHGREALTAWLLNELRPSSRAPDPNRFLAVIGASGSGKSSLTRAGLLPAIHRGEVEGSEHWKIAICRPGANPLENLAVAVTGALQLPGGPGAVTDLIASLGQNENTLHLTTRLAFEGESPEGRLMLLVDQFEEIFTTCQNAMLRSAFIGNLLHASHVAQGMTVVVVTMRADFFGKCATYADLAAALSDHTTLVGPMTEDELRRAIERPAQLVGCEFEPGLVDLLIHDVEEQPGALPLLQDALLELWKRRDGRRLTAAAYREIGKLEGALELRANLLLESFTEQQREICRRVFLRLSQPGEGTEDTKRRAAFREVASSGGDRGAIEDVITKLADARLVTTEGEAPLARDAFVEVSHEALIQNWSQLRKWLDADRAGLRTHRRLTEAAQQWIRSGRDKSELHSGTRLAVAREWAATHKDDLNESEREFLLLSQIEQGETSVNWLPPFQDFNALRAVLSCYLDASNAKERMKGIAALPELAAPEIDEEVRSFIFKCATDDPVAVVRNRAAEVLCRSGHAAWFINQLGTLAAAGPHRFRLWMTLAHCRNLPAIGGALKELLPSSFRKRILRLAVVELIVANLGLFATVFALVYVSVYATDEIFSLIVKPILIPMYTFSGDHARLAGLIQVASALSALQIALIATAGIFLSLRSDLDREKVTRRRSLQVGLTVLLVIQVPSLLSTIIAYGTVWARSDLPTSTLVLVPLSVPIVLILNIPLVMVLLRHFTTPLECRVTWKTLAKSSAYASLFSIMGNSVFLSVVTVTSNWGYFKSLEFDWWLVSLAVVPLVLSLLLSVGIALIAVVAFRFALRVTVAPGELPPSLLD